LFELYFKEILENTDVLYYNYRGISKKEYPKWEGWKIIAQYKELNYDIKEIQDEKLDTLVKNFYYIKYLEEG